MSGYQEILADLKQHLQKYYSESVKDVVLFGSRSRSDAKKYSDFDVLIIIDGDYTGKDENKIFDLCFDINIKYNILLDVHILSEKEVASIRGRQPIFNNALKSGLYA